MVKKHFPKSYSGFLSLIWLLGHRSGGWRLCFAYRWWRSGVFAPPNVRKLYFGDWCWWFDGWRSHITTNAGGLVIKDNDLSIGVGGPVIGDTSLTVIVCSLVARATTLIASSSGPVTESLALAAPVLSHRFW